MNFDKESKSEDFSFFLGGGGGIPTEKYMYSLIFVLMPYLKFQVPSSSGSLVLTQTKGVTER